MVKRHFLFLQGPATPFFPYLASMLRAQGHDVSKIHFNVGDLVYWFGGEAVFFRDTLEGLSNFLDRIYCSRGITDQILFGDRRPVHRVAVEHGAIHNVRTWVFEEGYFRPYWVTLERDGVNAHSSLPRDPGWFRDAFTRLSSPSEPIAFSSPFWIRAAHDVLYHTASAANFLLFPRYRTHAVVDAPKEYIGYAKRFSLLKAIRKREFARVRALSDSGLSYYVLPLQLNSDAQIRDHSSFSNMESVIEHVLVSFAEHAPPEAIMAIKNHPLDAGLFDFSKKIRNIERYCGLEGRVKFFEDGDLLSLIRAAKGLVTVNSTVGMIALEIGVPTIALSDAIYNFPGLTFQGRLDDFWGLSVAPEMDLFHAFRHVVMNTTQVNGGFYCRKGIALASKNALQMLTY